MRTSTILRLSALLGALSLAGLSAPAQDQSQQTGDPVADAARKARAQQQTAPKAKKVYTDDDFTSTRQPAKPVESKTDATAGQADTDQSTADQSGKKGLKPEDDPKQEAYWRKRFGKTRDKLAQAEKELEILQRELDKGEVQYYSDPQKAMMQQYNRSDINEKRGKIDAKQKEIAALKQQLSDLEDELRKAGGDPGWAR